MFKKIAIRLILLGSILFLSNFIYSRWFYEKDIQKHSEVINLVREIPENADIIYIGESSNNTSREDDIDQRYISEFIGDYYPDLKVCDITKPASHAGIYKILLNQIPESNQAKTLVVTLNLRSFNAQWIYSNLETSLQKSMILLKDYPPLLNRFLLSFKAYDIKNEDERTKQFKAKWKRDKFDVPFDTPYKNVLEWDKWMFHNGILDKNGNKDYEKTPLACHYIKAYAFQIDTLKNPRIQDFNEIIELAKKRNWNLVFNLLAENVEKAETLVGKELIYFINQNTQLLKNYYKRRGVLVVNNMNTVEDEQFIDQEWTTEHYAEKGRKAIAKNVAKKLKKWHSEYYQEVAYKQDYQTYFFNDCEGNTKWGQTQTITNERGHSSNKSSKIGNGNDYSITLEYPLKLIPKRLKGSVNVDFWLYQETLNHDAQLVIQASGYNFKDYWQGYSLKDKVKDVSSWSKCSFNITIPDEIKQTGLIKIYVYNPSNETIFIDDLKIELKKLNNKEYKPLSK